MLPAEHYNQGGYNNSRDWSPVNLARENCCLLSGCGHGNQRKENEMGYLADD